jgi:hypothetical protein
MPFRSLSHLNLHKALSSTGCARSTFEIGDRTFEFVVRAAPDYGLLDVDDISG